MSSQGICACPGPHLWLGEGWVATASSISVALNNEWSSLQVVCEHGSINQSDAKQQNKKKL